MCMSTFHPVICLYPPVPLKAPSQLLLPITAIAASLGSSLPSRIVLKRPNADEQVERAAAIANKGEILTEIQLRILSAGLGNSVR